MFSGERIRLRAVEKSDIEHVMNWVNNREITRWLPDLQLPVARLAEQAYLERVVDREHPRDRYYTVESLAGDYLGAAGLHGIDWVNRRAELGIIIAWPGQGYGSDTVRTLLRVAFRGLNLEKVYLRTTGSNSRAIACYRKCGFMEIGRLRQHRWLHGKWEDEVFMEIFREEWMEEGNRHEDIDRRRHQVHRAPPN